MPWQSGTFVRTDGVRQGTTVWQQADGAGVNIEAPDHDVHDQDIAGGITETWNRSGQNSPTQDLPMSGYKFTGVGNAAARNQFGVVGQVQDNAFNYAVDTGAANAITIAPNPPITANVAGQQWLVLIAATNTATTVTLSVSGITGVPVKNLDGTDPAIGDIVAGTLRTFTFDGTNAQIDSASGDIPDGAVTTAKLADNAVTEPKIAANAVTTAKIINDAVTAPKIDLGTQQGEVFFRGATADLTAIVGANDEILVFKGAGADPVTEPKPAAGIFTALYESPGQTITSGGALSLTHSLGGEPRGITYILQCTTADAGYGPGDRVVHSGSVYGGVGGRGLQAIITATQIQIRYGSNASVFDYIQPGSGNIVTLTNANWDFYVTAWR